MWSQKRETLIITVQWDSREEVLCWVSSNDLVDKMKREASAQALENFRTWGLRELQSLGTFGIKGGFKRWIGTRSWKLLYTMVNKLGLCGGLWSVSEKGAIQRDLCLEGSFCDNVEKGTWIPEGTEPVRWVFQQSRNKWRVRNKAGSVELERRGQIQEVNELALPVPDHQAYFWIDREADWGWLQLLV